MYKFLCSSAVALFIIAATTTCSVQKNSATSPMVVSTSEVARVENALASDEMRGRKTGSPEIDKAADFIAGEFKKAGLQPLAGDSYLQEFVMLRPRLGELKYTAGGIDIDRKNIIVITGQASLNVDEKSGYTVATISAGENLFSKAQSFAAAKKNTIVLVDTSMSKNFARLTGLKRQIFRSPFSTIFILGSTLPNGFKITTTHSFEEIRFKNVAGILPGRSRKGEQVIFSGHYDHLGVGKPEAGDSIYNGANDDAAGITAVILLADHFKKLGNNERTLVFVAFTAEEIGGFGSQYFSQQMNPATITAMFNIEMIGTESKWGKNSAFITGFEKTNMGEILQANLKGTAFQFYPDPYTKENLFYRSDNATLARLGVPAHTISTSKMDSEPNYHKASDEVKTLDLDNMAQIIKAIAESSRTIVSGRDTPSRVKAESLQ
ncbi:MAG: family metallo-hydrolase [Flavisolibacter sp.]|jgi:Zn-dependent M28 family amino/carboxypeptidase|nr:family metallo-hydrolase [Flavisolibacter sp.]